MELSQDREFDLTSELRAPKTFGHFNISGCNLHGFLVRYQRWPSGEEETRESAKLLCRGSIPLCASKWQELKESLNQVIKKKLSDGVWSQVLVEE